MITCPHCQKEFEPKSHAADRKHLSGKTFQWAFLVILLAMAMYWINGQSSSPVMTSVTNFQANVKQAYQVFDQVSTNIQGHIAKQVRLQVKTNDKSVIIAQAKELIAAERNNNPTNIIYLYFYVTDKDPEKLPLDSWNAKVTFINFSIIRDLSPGDFAKMENIAPGTYLEIRN